MLSLKLAATLLLLLLGGAFFRRPAKYLLGFIRNRRAARETGIPYVSVPFLDFNVYYGIFARSPLFAPLVDRVLPAFLTSWVPYARPDWRFIRKYEVHRELGDLFQVVTPELVVINIADADVIREILTRRNDFTKVQRTLREFRCFPSFIFASCTDFFYQHLSGSTAKTCLWYVFCKILSHLDDLS